MPSPRGIRNHNPGNLRKTADKWQGLAKHQPDAEFFTFETAAYGIRALVRTLITYQDKYDLRSVNGLISRWAPPVENNTSAYAAHVASRLGVGLYDEIDVHDYGTARALAEAIIAHENGTMPYSDATMREALLLAGVKPPMKPVQQSRTLKAGSVAAGTAGIGLVAEAAQQIAPAVPLVEAVGKFAPWAVGVLVIAAVGYMAYRYIEDRKVRVA